MAPHSEGKRPRVPKPLPKAIDKQNPNSKGENPQIVPKLRSAQVIAMTGVSQPGSSSRSKPRYSRSTTPGTPAYLTSSQPRPQEMSTPSAVGIAQALLPNPSPTTATKTRYSSSQALTTAENVRELNISGGFFLNTPQAVVQVCGGVPSAHQPVNPEEIPHNPLTVPDLEDIGTGDTETQSAHPSMQSKGKAKANSQCTQIKEYDVYYRQLLLAGRGSPMWIPGPNMRLPKEYRRNGIGIGDVGIVYRSEGFSFLFNIFLPADHPINKGRVPDDFELLDLGQVEKDLEKTIVYGPKQHLASSSLRNVGGVDSSGLVFETVASEGAILIMPDGATTEDLLNHKLVKKYIAKNAQSWYTYIREERGREVANGDIRLVIGFDKVASWGIATFASSVEQQVRLEFKTNGSDQAASRAYTWNCVGGGSGRVGPHEEEMDGLRGPNNSPAAATEFVLKNQTVFVRTLNFNLKGEAWDDLTAHEIRSSDYSSKDSGPPSNQQPPSGSSGSQSGAGSRESHSGQGNVNFQAAQFGLSVVQHPSNQINDLLLKKFPNAHIVITVDADWISVLTKEDVMFPSPEDLYTRLLSSRKIRENNGVVTFCDDYQSCTPASPLEHGPSGKLPIELLSEILLLCIDDSMDDDNTIGIPLLLTKICSRWRSAAISNPRLWSRLRLHLIGSTSTVNPALVDIWLRRSGSCPLTLYLFWEEPPFSDSHVILKKFMIHSYRWKVVFFYLPSCAFPCFQKIRGRLPMLTHLSLGTGDEIPKNSQILDMFEIAPRLQSIECINFSPIIFKLPQAQLRDIPLMSGNIFECFSILNQAKKLSKLSYIFTVPAASTKVAAPALPISDSHVYHNLLTSLKIMTPPWNECVDLTPFFHHVRLPYLETLTICNLKCTFGEEFIQFLSVLHGLQTLHLRKISLPDDKLIEGLKHLPSLTTLIIQAGAAKASERRVSRYLLEALTWNFFSNDTTEGMLLPHLKKLDLTVSLTAAGGLDTFIDMLQSRLRADEQDIFGSFCDNPGCSDNSSNGNLGLARLEHVRVRPCGVDLDDEFLIRLLGLRDLGLEVELGDIHGE